MASEMDEKMKSFDLKTTQNQLKMPNSLLTPHTIFISSRILLFREVIVTGGFIFEWNIF